MSFDPPSAALPAVAAAPAPPPMFGTAPGSKPKKQSMQPSFLGSGAAPPPAQLGQKTLLGQ